MSDSRAWPRRAGITLLTEPSLAPLWDRALPLLDQDPPRRPDHLRRRRHAAARRPAPARPEVPILGVNLGRVGFLTTATRDQLAAPSMRWSPGDYILERRLALHATIVSDEATATRSEQRALNDVAVHKSRRRPRGPDRVSVDGEDLGPYSADGIIVATPHRVHRLLALGRRADRRAGRRGDDHHTDLRPHPRGASAGRARPTSTVCVEPMCPVGRGPAGLLRRADSAPRSRSETGCSCSAPRPACVWSGSGREGYFTRMRAEAPLG